MLIEKILISVGTNDIRHCRKGIGHLNGPLKQLGKSIKDLTPSSKVFFQSLLPLPLLKNAAAKSIVHNILSFNQLLMNFCIFEKFYFMNIFNHFLDLNGQFRNIRLFKSHGDIHPNNRGIGVLAKSYIIAIHNKSFNPLVYQ